MVLDNPESARKHAAHGLEEIRPDGVFGTGKPLEPEISTSVQVELVTLQIEVNVKVETLLWNFEVNVDVSWLGVERHGEMRKLRLDRLKGSNDPLSIDVLPGARSSARRSC